MPHREILGMRLANLKNDIFIFFKTLLQSKNDMRLFCQNKKSQEINWLWTSVLAPYKALRAEQGCILLYKPEALDAGGPRSLYCSSKLGVSRVPRSALQTQQVASKRPIKAGRSILHQNSCCSSMLPVLSALRFLSSATPSCLLRGSPSQALLQPGILQAPSLPGRRLLEQHKGLQDPAVLHSFRDSVGPLSSGMGTIWIHTVWADQMMYL